MTATAAALLNFLRSTGGAWEQDCINHLFPSPTYPRPETEDRENKQRAYWQHDVNMYGTQSQERPVGERSEVFRATADYSKEVSRAYQELRKAGLADERNNGFNEYSFYPKY